MRGKLAFAGIMLVASIAAPESAASAVPTTPIASLTQEAGIGAYGETVAWSAYDDQAKSFRLAVARDGKVELPPVKLSKLGFQVDVGPGRRDAATLVYRRCRSSRNCSFFTFDLDTQRERKLPVKVGPLDVQPSIWRDRLGFIESRRRIGKVWSVDLRNPRKRREIPLPQPQHEPQPIELDVDAAHAAVVAFYHNLNCSHEVRSTVVLAGSRKSRMVAAVCPGESGQSWAGATLDRGKLYFDHACCERGGVYRFDIRSGRYWWGANIDPEVSYYARGTDTNYAEYQCFDPACGDEEFKLVSFPDSRFKRVARRFVYRPASS